MTPACMEAARRCEAPAPLPACDKWAILRELGVARRSFGLSDRDLALLQALISFHPESELRDGTNLIVFPSNKALSNRAHGMAESTLRRRLSVLVDAGMLLRHDSPNGKRYAARDGSGIARAFGFDLRPLLLRAPEILEAAGLERERQAKIARLREAVVLALRDIEGVAIWGRAHLLADWDAPEDVVRLARRTLRRKLNVEDLQALLTDVHTCRDQVMALLPTEEPSGCDSQNERHIQESNILESDSDQAVADPDMRQAAVTRQTPEPAEKRSEKAVSDSAPSVDRVLSACPDLRDYVPNGVRHRHELVAIAGAIAGYMGIDASTWAHAQREMGPDIAATTVSAMLQCVKRIAKPGAYLRSLARKYTDGRFSPENMLRSLERAQAPGLA